MTEYKVEDYDLYIKMGVVSFETAKLISSDYDNYCNKSYTYREAIKEDIPDNYKKYEDWYPHEIRDELGDEKANEILETVWYLSNFGCFNKEYNDTFVAPSFQEVIDWVIKNRNVVLGVAYLNKTKKWVYTSQSIYMPDSDADYHNDIMQYNSSKDKTFDTWQEALDYGIQITILQTNTINNNGK